MILTNTHKVFVMLEIADNTLQSFPLDHHGLIASVCLDLKIAERIDSFLTVHEKRTVSPGQAVVAMILNGLGFTNRRLYLTPQFFASKAVERLFDAPISAKDLNDYTLGHTLDQISEYGVSNLFAQVAFGIALEHKLLGGLNHLDTTTISVSGEYEKLKEEGEPALLEVTHGHSKDHRPDLKQVVLSLVVNGPSHMPIWMEALDGNSSDKTSFHETIRKVREFQKQMDVQSDLKWVADSALYSKDKLLAQNDYLWLTRVPETVKEAKEYLSQGEGDFQWIQDENGYQYTEKLSVHGNIPQRWVMIFSEQAYAREKKTLEKNLVKREAQLGKDIWHLGNAVFGCAQDAEAQVARLAKEYPLHLIEMDVSIVKKFESRGKPAAHEEPKVIGYKVACRVQRNAQAMEAFLNRKGRFILATNDMDAEAYPASQILKEYKAQQNVERGFRFLKDPWFMVDSVFLKSPRRIEALMMVMALCLLVYNLAQYKLRDTLRRKEETLPNQLNKEVQNPTLRWIFQIMEGLVIVKMEEGQAQAREWITNLSAVRKKIIQLFGPTACRMHGLNPESAF